MLREVLERLVRGKISVDEAETLIRVTNIAEMGNIAKLDVGREVRKGIPEIILAEGKMPDELAKIALEALKRVERVIISRASEECMNILKNVVPKDSNLQLNERAGIIVIKNKSFVMGKTGGKIGVLTAGTSDVPIAEEAKIIAEEMGCEVLTAYDVGVAGIHRLFAPLKRMIEKDVDVIVIIAGREGALPSVVAGMVDIPVIGVPTSIGYGLGGRGVSALMAMLQACSLGLAVVNIDAGVAGGAVAAMIANRVAKGKKVED